jgi:beta-1,4-N-acetylglucosaminyltransferase
VRPAAMKGVLSKRDRKDERAEILLVCSEGGHLLQLVALEAAWEGLSRVWVTLDKSDARSLLANEQVVFARGPTHRNVWNLVRNAVLAWKIIGARRPRVLVTTGAAPAVPFAWVSWLRGVRIVYIESITRIDSPSMSCRLVRPVADRLYVQWPDLLGAVEGSVYAGRVIAGE